MSKNIVLTMLAAAGLACSGSAAEVISLDSAPVVEAAYSSKDLWRGVNQGDNDLSVRVGADLQLLGFVANTSVGWNDSDDQDQFEFSIGTEYGVTVPVLDDVTLHAGFNYYSEGTDVVGDIGSELGLGVSKDLGLANVTLTQFIATQGDNDGYGELSADFSEVYPGVFFTLTAGYLLEEIEVTHFEASFVLPGMDLPKFDLELKPFVKGVYTFNNRGGIWSSQDGLDVVGGLRLSRSF
ncbi:hypothetical protein N9Z65_00615 [bacterium]|nr:hypothetical protein [bacterium]